MIPERRLLAAVVAQAIRDASAAPIKEGKRAVRLPGDARSAMAFLFGPGLDAYAMWLDFDPDQFRNNLLDMRPGVHLSDEQRRNFRFNYRSWTDKK